jgi:hypothetical protein
MVLVLDTEMHLHWNLQLHLLQFDPSPKTAVFEFVRYVDVHFQLP